MGKKRRKKEEAVPAEVEEIVPAEAEAAPVEEPPTEVEASAETPVEETAEEVGTETEPAPESETETPAEPVLSEEPEPTAEENSEPSSEAAEAPAEATGEEPDLRYQLKHILEAIMFASQKPLSAKEIISVLKGAAEVEKEKPNSHATPFAKVKEPQLRAAIEELELDYSDPSRTYEVRESAAGWQLVTKPDFAPWLRQLFPENRSARLSAPAMETLAIIAYRQPITRADIEAVRGVAVDGVMQTLLDRGLIKIDGRAEIPGRPLLYGTTQNFMEHFGLKHLDDLPNSGELRKISLPTAEPPPAEPPAPTEKAAETVEAPTGASETPEPTPTPEDAPVEPETTPPAEPAPAPEPEPVFEEEPATPEEEAEVPSAETTEPSGEEPESPIHS